MRFDTHGAMLLHPGANHSITRLTYVHVDPSDGRRRRLVPLGGVAMQGNLHTLGYFAGERLPAASKPVGVGLPIRMPSAPCAHSPTCAAHFTLLATTYT